MYKFREGDYLVICDRSGQKRLRSECVKQWDGLIVAREYAEARHPLDFQRAVPAERAPRETRPPGELKFIAPWVQPGPSPDNTIWADIWRDIWGDIWAEPDVGTMTIWADIWAEIWSDIWRNPNGN